MESEYRYRQEEASVYCFLYCRKHIRQRTAAAEVVVVVVVVRGRGRRVVVSGWQLGIEREVGVKRGRESGRD